MNPFRSWWLMGAAPAIAVVGILVIGQAKAESVSIKGTVVDQKGLPVPQEPVMVDGGDRSATTITNSQGEFVVFNLPSGDYDVSAAGTTERVRLEPARPWWTFRHKNTPVYVDLTATEYPPMEEKPAEQMSIEELEKKAQQLREQLKVE